MTDWIDFAVYAAFLVTICFVFPTTVQKLAVPMATDRNAEWVTAHPDLVRKIGRRRWHVWSSYTFGIIALGALANFQLGPGMPPGRYGPLNWMSLAFIAAVGAGAATLVIGVAHGFNGRALRKLIPLATQRQATLARRSLSDLVPRWFQFVTYALIGANIVACVTLIFRGTPGFTIFIQLSNMFWQTFAIFIAIRAVVAGRPGMMDRIFGPPLRNRTARYLFSVLIFVQIIFAIGVYEKVTGEYPIEFFRAALLFFIGFSLYFVLRIALLRIDDGSASSGEVP